MDQATKRPYQPPSTPSLIIVAKELAGVYYHIKRTKGKLSYMTIGRVAGCDTKVATKRVKRLIDGGVIQRNRHGGGYDIVKGGG
jgi:hypothetical protein